MSTERFVVTHKKTQNPVTVFGIVYAVYGPCFIVADEDSFTAVPVWEFVPNGVFLPHKRK